MPPDATTYQYDGVGRLITTTLPNDVVSVNGYDDANRQDLYLAGKQGSTCRSAITSGGHTGKWKGQTMELTLANFRQALDTVILERGRRYYADGRVMDLDEVDTGCWQAVVQATDNYQAEISITEDGNLEWACDCPYDCGPACKHIVAVL